MHLAAVLAVLLSAAEPPPTGEASTSPPPAASAGALQAPVTSPTPSPPPPAATEPAPRSDPEQRSRVVGVQLGVGFPEGFSAAGVLRPLPWLRGDLGVGWNALSFGIMGGVTFTPWSGPVIPTFRLAGGQFFKSDVRDELGGTFPDAFDPSLSKFGYRFFSAQVGLEMGNDNGLAFFLRGGLAWISSDLDSATFTEGDTTVRANQNELSATTPSLQLGVVWHLW